MSTSDDLRRLREFRRQVCNALGECVACLPAGETWAATDDSVVQYIRDIVAKVTATGDRK